MKVLFIEAKKKIKELKDIGNLEILPDKLHILYSIQYKNLAGKLKKQLEKRKTKILGFEQVLGCSKIKPKASLLLVGSGRFHALSLALSSDREIYIYEEGNITKISGQEIEKLKQKERGKLSKFLSSDKSALLVSIKPGQNKLNQALEFKTKLKRKWKDKKSYVIVADTVSKEELENFPFDIWVNFACPGLDYENGIISYEKLEKEI